MQRRLAKTWLTSSLRSSEHETSRLFGSRRFRCRFQPHTCHVTENFLVLRRSELGHPMILSSRCGRPAWGKYLPSRDIKSKRMLLTSRPFLPVTERYRWIRHRSRYMTRKSRLSRHPKGLDNLRYSQVSHRVSRLWSKLAGTHSNRNSHVDWIMIVKLNVEKERNIRYWR